MANTIHALLIDDDNFNLEVLNRYLTNVGYRLQQRAKRQACAI